MFVLLPEAPGSEIAALTDKAHAFSRRHGFSFTVVASNDMAGLPFWDYPQVKVVKYEDFVVDPGKVLGDICLFLKEDSPDTLLEYHQDKANWYSKKSAKLKAVKKHSDQLDLRNWQINQPIFDGRGKWEKDMSASEKKAFKASPAQDMLVKFGYVERDDW